MMETINKLYFIGAGSTSHLNIPTTQKQEEYIKNIIWIRKKFSKNNSNDFFKFELLKNFIKNYFTKENFNINACFNIIDLFIKENMMIKISNQDFSINDLKICRDTLSFIIFNEFYKNIKKNFKNEKLSSFYEKLARNALDKKIKEYKSDLATTRKFIFTDYAIINLNWDLYSIIPMFKAHQKINNENNYYLSRKSDNTKLKIFNDFGAFMACNGRDKKDIWYPYNESVATRVNDVEYKSSRIVTLVKTYYPHGLMNLYQCKYCNKHVLNVGNIDYDQLINKDSLFENKEVLKCPFCNNEIREFDVDYLAQSNYKNISHYLYEIRYEMFNAIRNCNEIIFIGYSLPIDDIEYNNVFRSLINTNKKPIIKVIGYDKNYKENVFKSINECYSMVDNKNQDLIKRYQDVFGDNVIFNFIGVPKCFENNDIY